MNKEDFLTTLAPLPDPQVLQTSVSKNVAEKARNIYQKISSEIIFQPDQVCSSAGLDVTSWISPSTEKAVFELVNLALNHYDYELQVDEKKCYLHIHQDTTIEETVLSEAETSILKMQKEDSR